MVTAHHAKARAVCVLPDGRTARVVFVPPPWGKGRKPGATGGRKARLQLSTGAFITERPDRVRLGTPEDVRRHALAEQLAEAAKAAGQ